MLNNQIWLVLLIALGISLFSLSGIIFSPKFIQKWLNEKLALILALTSGIFLVSSLNIFHETVEIIGFSKGIISLLLGIILVSLVEVVWPESHHHHDNECSDCLTKEQNSTPPRVKRMLIGDAIHNFGDGIILFSTFVISPALGIITTISIASHEFIQEISEYLVFIGSGMSKKEALKKNFISGTTIILGVLAGFLIKNIGNLEPWLLGISSGAFLFIVFHDLIPNAFSEKTKKSIHPLLFFMIGALIILGISLLFPHEH